MEALLNYYEYPGTIFGKTVQDNTAEYKKTMQCDWITTISDVYQRYLKATVPFFYVFTKSCAVLFTYENSKKPMAVMNVTLRSMHNVFEKYGIQCNIVLKDMTETPLQSADSSNEQIASSQTGVDDFQAARSSQFIFDTQWYYFCINLFIVRRKSALRRSRTTACTSSPGKTCSDSLCLS